VVGDRLIAANRGGLSMGHLLLTGGWPALVFGCRPCYNVLVRGDSLRDLYAKTLAVLGLSVLAGVGALVDYWPAGIRYPVVASTFSPSTLLPSPLTVASARVVPPAPVSRATPVRARQEQSPAPELATFSVYEPALPLGAELQLGSTQVLTPVPSPVAVVARRIDFGAAAIVELDEPADEALSPAVVPTDAVSDESADTGDRGFVSDALNRTTTSLVRTGRWTGASIVSAVRVMRDVVGRAIPN